MTRLLPLLLLSVLSAPLSAEPVQATRAVQTSDLDLSSPAGVRTLEHRLTIAIADACGEAWDVDLAGRNQVRACVADANIRAAGERDRILAAGQAPSSVRVAAR